MDNWLLIIVGTIFLICIAFGYVRGFLKLGLSLLSTILTLVLVLFLSPHVTRALKEYTPVDDFLESKVTEKFMPEITSEQLQSIDLTGTPLENLTAEDISKLNEMDWDVLGITADDILSVIGDIPKDVQINLIEEAPLPRFLKDQLIENNNSTIYGELGVKSFPRYVAAYASHLVLNLLSFLGLANHIAGGALGLLLALVIVWIGFLIMTLAYTTEAGSACFEMVEKSSILRFLYETNPLLIRLLKF
jgi:uncharacterized membrane protein required for colicin V production